MTQFFSIISKTFRSKSEKNSLGHQGGEEFSERGKNFLNYVQHIFPGWGKIFLGGGRVGASPP